MNERMRGLPFVILFIMTVLFLYKITGEAFTIGFLSLVLIGVVFAQQEKLTKLTREVIRNG